MKFKPFLLIIIISALFIAGTAALFSVTGIASLFSGHFISVALMAGVLEGGKLVVASFLYRYWYKIGKIFKVYLLLAMLGLMVITSAGIFGYLSESYQTTKGDFTIVQQEVQALESKKQVYVDRKARLQSDKELEIRTKESNQTRADSLTARGYSINRTRDDIKASEDKIALLENQITSVEDSIGAYDLRIIESKSKNIKGELGPLQYIATAFDTDMDTAVKYFIFLLIFVFDPLAISLVIAANMVYGHRVGKDGEQLQSEFTEVFFKKKDDKETKEEEHFSEIELKKLKTEYEHAFKDVEQQEELYDNNIQENEEPKEITENVVETEPEKPKVVPAQPEKTKIRPKWRSAGWRT